jgi:hypothetical protein
MAESDGNSNLDRAAVGKICFHILTPIFGSRDGLSQVKFLVKRAIRILVVLIFCAVECTEIYHERKLSRLSSRKSR